MPLYHVTLISNLESIMANGLIPQVGALSEMVGEQPGVFLFPNYADCENAHALVDNHYEYDHYCSAISR